MQFLLVLAMLTASSVALCNVQVSGELVSRLPILHRLVYTGQRTEFLRLLPEVLDYVNDKDREGRTPLHWAVYANDIDSVKDLLEHGADPNMLDSHDLTPLHEAARLGSSEMVNIILESGGDANFASEKSGWNSLFWAARSGKKEVMEIMMSLVDPSSKDEAGVSVFRPVAQGNDPDKQAKIKLLVDAGVELDIGLAILFANFPELDVIAHQLKSFGNNVKVDASNVNAKDADGVTPLMRASLAGSVTAAEMLLEHGADLNAETRGGINAIVSHYETNGQREVAKLLLKRGIEVRNKSGRLAFLIAAQRGDTELASLLLHHVTAGDRNKNPVPDSWFFDNKRRKILNFVNDDVHELLLSYGANTADPNSVGNSKQETQEAPADKWGNPQGMPNFLVNFNALAAQGKFKPVIGRDQETQQVITALARKDKSNAMLIGEAGVGKTAIVEGLAQRIVAGDVPETMQDTMIFALDMGELLSNTMARGMLEERIQQMLHFVTEQYQGKAILFIDEVHQLISSGTAQGAADQLKTSLARGDLHCIGATTQDEFQQHILKDAALERRFLPVTVEEPLVEDTIAIVKGLKHVYEEHHGFPISDAAAQGAAKLAEQFITGRFNPDKAIEALDMAAAKLAVSGEHSKELQYEHVAEAISEITGVPVERMLMSQQDMMIELLPALRKNIFGQERVLQEINDYLASFLVGTSDPNRPASMLFLGPSGVGKTETAKELAEHFFGAPDNMISINLSEYRERHAVDSLIGSPSGYVGFEQGGILTEAVRRKPFSVLLFDEIGEAHHTFAGILLKILDEGELTDKKGRTINFRNTIIVITGNTDANKSGNVGFKVGTEEAPNPAQTGEVELKSKVLGRLGKPFVYDALPPEVMGKVLDKELAQYNALLEKKNISVSLTDTLRKHLRKEGYSPELGARAVQKIFRDLVESPLAMKIAAGELKEGHHYRIGLKKGEITVTSKPAPQEHKED